MENWIARVVGKMHVNNIKQVELAKYIGVSPEYLSTILNGKRKPKKAKERIMQAVDEICASREKNNTVYK